MSGEIWGVTVEMIGQAKIGPFQPEKVNPSRIQWLCRTALMRGSRATKF
jgi:hypothetical protein